jgi:hypothetical protein
MSSSIAFALRAGDEDTFAGAVLCVGPNGEALDTKAALDEGDGVIVVPDTDSGRSRRSTSTRSSSASPSPKSRPRSWIASRR